MTRLEELQKRDGRTLSIAEKNELKMLLAQQPEEKKEATVTLSAKELADMVAKEVEKATAHLKRENAGALRKTASDSDWKEVDKSGKRKKDATFRMYRPDSDHDFGIIIDWKWLKNVYDEETRKHDKQIYRITVMEDGGEKKEYEIPLMDFAKIQDYERVDIIEEQVKELVKSFGKVQRSAKNKEGYLTPVWDGTDNRPTGQWVDANVTMNQITCTVRRPNGEELTVSADRLNA